MKQQRWLETARTLYSLSQAGLAYSQNPFDVERYKQLQRISAEIVSDHSNLATDEIENVFSLQAGYPTPKVDVRAALVENGQILMVRELSDGNWSMPGGWADLGDSPARVAERETFEESGYVVKALKLVGVFNNSLIQPLDFYHAYKLVFLCQRESGEPRPSYESLEVAWQPIDCLPALSTNRTPRRVLDEVLEHIANPARESYFE